MTCSNRLILLIVPLPHPPDNEHPLPEKLEKIAGRVKGSGRVS